MDQVGGSTEWTKPAIEEFLSKIDYSYHKIELPFGLTTKGNKHNWLIELIFGDSLRGKTVLDLGSYLGYFSLEACIRDADHVVGLEIDPMRIKEAQIIAEIKGLKPEYRLGDIESIDIEESFDIVLCLNLLHHLYNPLGVLHKIARITKQTLIIEFASFGKHDSEKLGLSLWLRKALNNRSVILVQPGVPKIGQRIESQKYFFSEKALVNILKNHTKLFSEVEVFPSNFKNRKIIRATRRKIGHLVVVAGPTSSGKSSFIKAIKTKSLSPTIIDKMPENIIKWPQIGASHFLAHGKTVDNEYLSADPLEGLLLHYDLLRPYTAKTHDYNRDQILDLIDCSEQLTVFTIIPEKNQLINQLVNNELGGKRPGLNDSKKAGLHKAIFKKNTPFSFKRLKGLFRKFLIALGLLPHKKRSTHHQKLYFHYQEDGWLDFWYDKWSDFLRAKKKGYSSVIVAPGPTNKFQWLLRQDNTMG